MRRAQRRTGNRKNSQGRPQVPDTKIGPSGYTGNDNQARDETSGPRHEMQKLSAARTERH